MNIDYTVTALMFPAIPLLMSVYSNRFHSLSILIRELHDEHVYENHIPNEWKKQFINLSARITLLRRTIMFAAFGFLFNMLTVFGLYLNEIFLARLIFGSCCLSMIISIIFFIREIQISTNALKLHMSDMDVDVN
jgi:Protein of unknown function (DUF2721).